MKSLIHKFIKKFYKNGVVASFLISYMAILVFPIIFNVMNYNLSQKTVKNVLESYNVNFLNKTVNEVDVNLYSIKQTMLNITLDKTFSEFQYVEYPFTPDEMFEVVSVKENVQKFETANQIISEMYVYYTSSNMIFGSSNVYTPQVFFELLDENNKYNSFEDWLKNMQSANTSVFNNVHITKMKENDTQMLTFVCKSATKKNGQPLMTGIIFVDIDRVKGIIENEFKNINGIIYVFDNKGNEIIKTDEKGFDLSGEFTKFNNDSNKYSYLTLNGNEYLSCRHISSVNDWHYILLMPTKESLVSLYRMKNILLINILMALIFGVGLVILFSMKNAKPIHQLLNKFIAIENNSFSEKNIWEYINKSTDMIIQNDKNLKESLQQYKPIIRKSYLLEILNGSENNRKSLEFFEISFPYSNFIVLLFDFTHDKVFLEENLVEERIKKELFLVSKIELQFNKKYISYTLEVEKGIIGVILNMAENDPIIDTIEMIKGELEVSANVLLTVAVGSKVTDITKIKNSYLLAKEALAYKIIRGAGSLILADELNKSTNHAIISIFDSNRERLIMEAIRNGNCEDAISLLENFTDELKNANLPIEFARCQFFSMMNIGFRVLSEIDVDYTNIFEDSNNPFDGIRKCSTIIEMSDKLEDVFRRVCQYISECRTLVKSNVINKIISYIDANYSDQNIGLTSLSESFNLSVSYLSYLFKEQTGTKFNEYLNSVRIENACKLLKNTNVSINEISLKVGYSNVVSFNRAFKRIYNMSPGQYRDL